jgi:hypothetical protein
MMMNSWEDAVNEMLNLGLSDKLSAYSDQPTAY